MKHRYELPLFSFYDHTGMVCHLERMARRGWLLDKMGGVGWRYRRIEPRRLRFAMTYFPEITGFEPGTPEGHLRMEELCAGTGWVLAATAGKFQVYYNEDPDPVELETDPALQVQVIHRTMKKSMIPGYVLLMVSALLQLTAQILNLTRDYGVLYSGEVYYFSGFSWATIPYWLALLALEGLELSRYLLWYRRAKRRAEEGLYTPSSDSRWIQGLALLLLVLIVLSWVGTGQMSGFVLTLLGLMLCVFVISMLGVKVMKKLGVSARVNQIITIGLAFALTMAGVGVAAQTIMGRDRTTEGAEAYTYRGVTFTAYSQEIPLRLEDLGYPAGDDSTTADVQGSPLVTRTYCLQRSRIGAIGPVRPELDYIIADIHFRPLWNLCLEDFLGEGAREIDAAPWGAERAWQVRDRYSSTEYTYVLCWEGRLVWLDLEEIPTDAQKAAAGEKLRP